MKNFGLMHKSDDPEIPLYGIICRTGKEWTVRFKERKTRTGSTISHYLSGYGKFPHKRFPDIPIIDLSGESFDRCFAALKIHDSIKPDQGIGTVEQFIQEHRKLGFKITFSDPCSGRSCDECEIGGCGS